MSLEDQHTDLKSLRKAAGEGGRGRGHQQTASRDHGNRIVALSSRRQQLDNVAVATVVCAGAQCMELRRSRHSTHAPTATPSMATPAM